jgi:hypothetical protein
MTKVSSRAALSIFPHLESFSVFSFFRLEQGLKVEFWVEVGEVDFVSRYLAEKFLNESLLSALLRRKTRFFHTHDKLNPCSLSAFPAKLSLIVDSFHPQSPGRTKLYLLTS